MSDFLKQEVGNAKKWYTSKTIIGIVIGFVPTIVKLINPEYTIDLDSIVEEGFTAAELIANTGDHIWVQITEVVGALVAIWGRIKAEVKLK